MDPNAAKREYRPPVPFSVKMLAKRWGCPIEHVRNMIRRGDLAVFRPGPGRLIRIRAQEVDRIESTWALR